MTVSTQCYKWNFYFKWKSKQVLEILLISQSFLSLSLAVKWKITYSYLIASFPKTSYTIPERLVRSYIIIIRELNILIWFRKWKIISNNQHFIFYHKNIMTVYIYYRISKQSNWFLRKSSSKFEEFIFIPSFNIYKCFKSLQ